jgi:hypothetical protein
MLSPVPPTRRKADRNQDLITGDEIISDSYNLKEIDGIVYEADCKRISVGGETIDIGANPSAEEGEEALDDTTQTVLDVAHSFRLQETSFDKKSYLSHLKSMFYSFPISLS